MPDDAALVASARLDADAGDAGRGQRGGEGAPAGQSIGDLPAFRTAVNRNVERGFGGIDSRRGHDILLSSSSTLPCEANLKVFWQPSGSDEGAGAIMLRLS